MQMQKGRGRGFASMSPEKKREIASKGGKAAHAMGTAHKWTSEEAQAAGRKGGSDEPPSPQEQHTGVVFYVSSNKEGWRSASVFFLFSCLEIFKKPIDLSAHRYGTFGNKTGH